MNFTVTTPLLRSPRAFSEKPFRQHVEITTRLPSSLLPSTFAAVAEDDGPALNDFVFNVAGQCGTCRVTVNVPVERPALVDESVPLRLCHSFAAASTSKP